MTEKSFLYGHYVPDGYTMFYPTDDSLDSVNEMLQIDVMKLHQDPQALEMLKSITLTASPDVFDGTSGRFKTLIGDEYIVDFENSKLGSRTNILSNEVVDGVRYVGVDRLLISQKEYWDLRNLMKERNIDISRSVDTSGSEKCERHRCRGFYKASKKQMQYLRKNDFFTWLCIHSYMMSPIINVMLFEVNGDWTNFNQTFSNVVETRYRIKKYSDPDDPYNIFNTFFKGLLIEGAAKGKFLTDKSRKRKITTFDDLVRYYPETLPYLTMQNKAQFVLEYAIRMTNAILSVPPLTNSLQSFRGYTPLNIPGTLTLDVDSYEIGDEIVNWGIMSLSLDRAVSAMFGDVTQACCMLKIIIPSGTSVLMIQSDPDDPSFPKSLAPFDPESEVLVSPGTILRIVKNTGVKTYIDMKGSTVNLKTAYAEIVGRLEPTV